MIVVSYYTDTGSYAEEARLLQASLDRVGMESLIKETKNRGDWYANTAYKSRFIQEMRKNHDGPILYVDVDAFMHEDCTDYFDGLAEQGVDFAAHWFRGPAKGHRQSEVRDEGWWLLSGTLFIGDTDMARHLLDTWCILNDILRAQHVPEGGGQKNLWFLTTCMDDLEIVRLPGRYCYVFDKAWAYPEDEPCTIEHTIASRDHRGGTHRKTRTRKHRITQLKKSVKSGIAAPHPRGSAYDQALFSSLEKAENRRHAAGRFVRDAKREYQSALKAEIDAREVLDGRRQK